MTREKPKDINKKEAGFGKPVDLELMFKHREILNKNQFLRNIYKDWYTQVLKCIPEGNGSILELGSGAGFIQSVIPNIITSDILKVPWVDISLSGTELPLATGSLKAIVMLNVFHHIPKPRQFLLEADRCLISGGMILMIEPWVSSWSKFFYKYFHSECIDTDAKKWDFISQGPMLSSNQALPWIIFKRDKEQFTRNFPNFDVIQTKPQNMFTYLVSGGFRLNLPIPPSLYSFIRLLESKGRLITRNNAMFASIYLKKK